MTTATTNKTNAEVMYGNFTNVSGQTMTTGNAVAFTTTAASLDGNSGVSPALQNITTFAGIVHRDVPNTQTGRYIAYGYAASISVFTIAGNVTVNLGDAMGPGVAGSLGVNSTGLKETLGPIIPMDTVGLAINNVAGGAGYIRGFVRAM